ncbi:winged helix-turn-helix domain-containing protein [Rheinheimera sp.]|uniref:winged helix-turn-helix domain-containing protein n=1 Tax=Rheinheimera sp. TaxID=1869214 RepID=UPI0027330B52|nr:winged helix-turn-helix domain-containing protein [Rheinheimera sp.]MDP2717015.1 winged helix-turn-helix domain-containing protein [Rheinheimera sp.]
MNPEINTEHTASWQLGRIIYESQNRQLQQGEQQLYLEPRQHKLLLVLLQHASQVVSREQLISSVWDGRIVSEGAINRAVSMLRKAFASLDPQTNYIETLPKLGYRLLPAATIIATGLPASRPAATGAIPHQRWFRLSGLAILLCSLAAWFLLSKTLPSLSAGNAEPHTGFNGRESQLSSNLAATALLYQRQTANGNYQIWLNTLADSQHHQLTKDNEDSRYPALSPDGSQFAFVRYTAGNKCQLVLQQITMPALITTEDNRRVLHQCPADNDPQLSWQADGQALFFRQRPDKTQPYQLHRLSMGSGVLHQLTLMPTNYSGLGDVALAPSATPGKLALLRYISTNASELQILNSNSGEIMHTQPLPVRANALAWYSDTMLLLSAGQTLYQYHIADASLSPLYHAADPINSFVVAGNSLYFSSTELSADIWQTDSQGTQAVRINSSRLDTMPRLSHDATQLAFLSTRHGHEQLWLQQPDGTERLLTELPGQPGFIRPEWSADDKQLLFSKDGAAYSVNIANAKLQTLLTADKQVGVVNWGPDSNSLLYSSQRDGDWQLWLYDILSKTEKKLTQQGGYSGRIWQGGLYFSKFHHDGLWYKDLRSGNEQLLLAQFDKINWLNWHIDQGQLYYYTPGQGIYRLNPANGDNTLHLTEPGRFIRHFNVRHNQTVFVRHNGVQGDIYRLPLSR